MPDPRYMHIVQKDINEKMRAILLDWLVDVHLKFKLLPETLFLTVNIIDRFLQLINIPRQKLQLVGITAMLIACKYEEIYVPEINDFVYVTDKAYTNLEVLEMEGNILSALEFNLTTVSPLRFLERYAKICNFDEKNIMMARYLLELSLIEYKMICYPPSMLACSAIYLVNKLRKKGINWGMSMLKHTKYNENNLNLCSKDIFHLLQNSEKSNLQAIRRKFTSPKFLEIVKIMEKK
jgi:G2/mitotic-specific cyclin-B, other